MGASEFIQKVRFDSYHPCQLNRAFCRRGNCRHCTLLVKIDRSLSKLILYSLHIAISLETPHAPGGLVDTRNKGIRPKYLNVLLSWCNIAFPDEYASG